LSIVKVRMVFYNLFAFLLMVSGFTLASITMFPDEASKLNLLGYFSFCSFAPISSVILLLFGVIGLFLLIRSVKSNRKKSQ